MSAEKDKSKVLVVLTNATDRKLVLSKFSLGGSILRVALEDEQRKKFEIWPWWKDFAIDPSPFQDDYALELPPKGKATEEIYFTEIRSSGQKTEMKTEMKTGAALSYSLEWTASYGAYDSKVERFLDVQYNGKGKTIIKLRQHGAQEGH